MKRIYEKDVRIDPDGTIVLFESEDYKYLVEDWSSEGFQSGVLCKIGRASCRERV